MVSMANSRSQVERCDVRKKISGIATSSLSGEKPGMPKADAEKTLSGIEAGDHVQVEGWSVPGVVEKAGRSSATVRIGSILVRKKLAMLTKVTVTEETTTASAEYSAIDESPEAVLLGMTVDEAIAELDIKLDNCVAIGLKRIRVVHGKGRLMQGVTEWLRRDKRLKSLDIASPEEGGTGASIILLKG
jgi:DNA mismatch repair protein MutS2